MRMMQHLRPAAILLCCLGLAACAAPSSSGDKAVLSRQSDQRLADTALAGGNVEMAIPLYKKILLNDPRDPRALIGLGNALYQSNELPQARLVWQQLDQVSPGQSDARIGLARVDVREGKYAEAARGYRAVLAVAPDNLAAEAGLGMVYDLQEDHGQAQQLYRRALARHPDDLSLRNNLGLSLILSHQLRAAIDELLKIVDVPSAPPQARYNLALAYGLLGNTAAAERILQGDMPSSQVQNNLQYYRLMRERLGLPGAAAAESNRR
jgi:Flp pilus assembly protein TadD